MSPRTRIGIEWSDTTIRFVCASRHGKTWTVEKRTKQELPEGAIVRGEIKNVEQCVEALKQGVKSFQHSGPAVLCLPPQKVYTSLLTLAPGIRPTEETIQAEAAGLFPEPVDSLQIAFTILISDKNGTTFGVAAVRKDVLKQYTDACAQAGIRIASMTTAPCAIAATQEKAAETYILLSKYAADVSGVLSFIHHDSPVDEAVLPPDANDAAIIASAKTMMQNYVSKDLPVQSVLVMGSEELLESVSTAFSRYVAPKKGAKKKDDSYEDSHSSIRVDSALQCKAQDLEWAGAIVAATHSKELLFDFSAHKKPAISIKKILATIAALAVVVALVIVGSQWKQWKTAPSSTADPVVAPVMVPELSAAEADATSIAWAQQEGILTEKNSTTFLADSIVSRQEFLRAVIRLSGSGQTASSAPPSGFTDIDTYPDLIPLLRYAKAKGMVSGTEFQPDNAITVASALKIAYIGLEIDPQSTVTEPWYAPYRDHALTHGVLRDSSTDMTEQLTRKMAVLMLWRLTQKQR